MIKGDRILLVEDNDGDILLTLESLRQAKIDVPVDVVKDGERALQYIWKEGEFSSATTPCLIMLDINLPRLNGKEVLAKIKSDSKYRVIPIVMLTTSNSKSDIIESYQNYANCYITKPADFKSFMEVIQNIKSFWMSIVQLPN